MLKHKDIFHGSDLEKIEQLYGIKKEDIVSFSANVNPLGISDELRRDLSAHIDAITSYPDREYTELRKCLSAYLSADPDSIIVGNGSTELISLFLQYCKTKKAIIVGPTYSEYEREIKLGGGTVNYYPLREADGFILDTDKFCESLDDSLDLCVICNPNNPTSTSISKKNMRKILDAALSHGIFVMIDETYVEFTKEPEKISSVPLTEIYTNLIILRGTSKFFAAPGLRLGYAITGNGDLRTDLENRKNPWSINSLAEIAGRLMFTDKEYIKKTRSLIDSERARLCEILSVWDSVRIYDPSANFLLMKILREDVDAYMLFDHCIRKKMMIRNCASFPYLDERYVRFCIMSPQDNDKLIAAFKELLG